MSNWCSTLLFLCLCTLANTASWAINFHNHESSCNMNAGQQRNAGMDMCRMPRAPRNVVPLEPAGDAFFAHFGTPPGMRKDTFANGEGSMWLHDDEDGSAEVGLYLKGLLPNALYSLRNVLTDFDVAMPDSFADEAFGAPDNTFWTNTHGNACVYVSASAAPTLAILVDYHPMGTVQGDSYKGALSGYIEFDSDDEEEGIRRRGANRPGAGDDAGPQQGPSLDDDDSAVVQQSEAQVAAVHASHDVMDWGDAMPQQFEGMEMEDGHHMEGWRSTGN